MSNTGTHTIIIPANLAELAVRLRETSGRYAVKTGKGYRVATDLHYLSFFCILKAYSPNSGQISRWTKEMDYLMAITNLSRRGIYKYINKLKEMELIEVDKVQPDGRCKIACFNLVSWDRLAEKYELAPFKKFIQISYEKDNRDHHPKYLIIQAEILHNQDKQAFMIDKKCRQFKQNYAQQQDPDFPTHKKQSRSHKSTPQEDRKASNETLLLWAKVFKTQSADKTSESEDEFNSHYFSFIRKINPSINRGLEGFKRAYSFTDLHRSIYLKKQLERRKFGLFKKSIKIYSEVGNRAPKYFAPQLSGPPVQKQMKGIYNRITQQSGTWLPDIYQPINQKSA